MRKLITLLIVPLVLLGSASVSWADKYASTIDLFRKSPEVSRFFNNSYGFAIFPTVGKGGFGVGGAHGKGRVYRGNSAVGKASLSQLTLGFQLGGQAFSQIIFFEDASSFKEFTEGSFEFGAQATAVAITVGAQAHAGTTGTSTGASVNTDDPGVQAAKYYKGMVTFIHVKGGLMYEASVGGQKFNYKPYGAPRPASTSSTTSSAPASPVGADDENTTGTRPAGPIQPITEVN